MSARRQKTGNSAPATTEGAGAKESGSSAEELQRQLSGEGDKDKSSSDTPPSDEGDKKTAPATTEGAGAKERYFVSAGKAITSRKGVRDQHTEVDAGMLTGGMKTLDSLKRRGVVYKAKFPATDAGGKQAALAEKVAAERGK